MHTIPSSALRPNFDSDAFQDRVETLSIKLLRVIKTLRLHADLAGTDDSREVTLDAETIGIAMDGIADDLDDARVSLLALSKPAKD
ncbi:hypothetical protein [Robbsia sp. KACC 23696]|uniref:hypothetical protein n=1 Tax=Robbsia sp. KACC 23696 TaxID=3149231 RepID=UPI00325B0632